MERKPKIEIMKLLALRDILKDASRRLGGLAPLFTGLVQGCSLRQSSEKARADFAHIVLPVQSRRWPERVYPCASSADTGARSALGAGLRSWLLATASAAAVAILLASGFGGAALAAAPAAGSKISNTAYVTYTYTKAATPGLGGLPVAPVTVTDFPSNTVEAIVQQVTAFTLTSSQTRNSPLGATVYFYHTLTNTGNGPDTFDLSTVASASPWVAAVTLYADNAPADGLPDSTVPITSTGTLAAGQSFTFVAEVTVPPIASTGQNKVIDIRGQGNPAAAATGGYTAAVQQTNTDTLQVTASAVLAPVGKSLSVSSGPSPSASSITVSIVYTNNTTTAATNFRITDWIGSSQANPVLNTTGMRYVAGSARWSSCGGGATALTDTNDGFECGPVGGRINLEVVYPSAPSTADARIEALIESVPPGTSGKLEFQVDVTGGLRRARH